MKSFLSNWVFCLPNQFLAPCYHTDKKNLRSLTSTNVTKRRTISEICQRRRRVLMMQSPRKYCRGQSLNGRKWTKASIRTSYTDFVTEMVVRWQCVWGMGSHLHWRNTNNLWVSSSSTDWLYSSAEKVGLFIHIAVTLYCKPGSN
jgi:hypothetical protein